MEALVAGAVIMTGLLFERVLQAVPLVTVAARGAYRPFGRVSDYEGAGVLDKVIRIIHGYMDHVNGTTWRE